MDSQQRSSLRSSRPDVPPADADLWQRLRLSARIVRIGLISAGAFLVAETLVRALVVKTTGSLIERLRPQSLELAPSVFAAVLIVGLAFCARWLATRRERERAALTERTSQLESVVRSLPCLGLCLSRELRVLEFNAQAERFFGRAHRDMVGQDFLATLVPQAMRDTLGTRLRLSLAGDSVPALEAIMPSGDGTGRLISWEFSSLRGPQGPPFAVVVLGRDITAERASLDALRAAGQRQREIVEHMSRAVIVCGAIHGGSDFVVHELNPAAERLERVSRSQLLGRRLSEALPGIRELWLREVLQRVWRTGQAESHCGSFRRDAQAPSEWREYAVGKLPEGALIAVYDDVSERMRVQHERERIAWLLADDPLADEPAERVTPPAYGDLSALNGHPVIRDGAGREVLRQVAADYLGLLDTSLAVFENSGDYALGRACSGWCRLLDEASRRLCKTESNREAIDGGQWLCHESCWNGAAHLALATAQPVDVPCTGGLRLYAVPIFAGEDVIGALCGGYGDPPEDAATRQRIAARYQVPLEELTAAAAAHRSRPGFLIDAGKQRLRTTAQLLGALVSSGRDAGARRDAESRLRDLSQATSDWIWEVDAAGAYTYSSDRVRDVLGYEPADVIGRTPFELMPAAAAQELGVVCDRLAQRKEPLRDLEHEKLHRDGHPVPVLSNAVPLLDEQGRLRGYRGVDRDLTAARQIAAASDAQREELRLIGAHAREGMVMTQGQIVRATNAAFLALAGLTEGDLLGRPFTAFVHPDDRQRISEQESEALLGSGSTGVCEYRVVTHESGPCWVEGSAVRAVRGGRPAVLHFVSDIAARRLAEEARRASEERYRLISAHVPVIAYTVSPAAPAARSFTAGPVAEMTGHSEEEFRADAGLFRRLIHPDDREKVAQQIDTRVAPPEGWDVRYRILTRRGQVRWVRDTAATQLDEHGQLVQFNGLLQDVSPQRELEEELEARRRELRAITDSAPMLIAYLDADARHHLANESYCRTLKRSRREIVGRRLEEILAPEACAGFADIVRGALSGRPVNAEIALGVSDAEAHRLRVDCIPDTRGGEVRGVFLFAADITSQLATAEEIHRLQAQLEEARAMERSARERLEAVLVEARQAGEDSRAQAESAQEEARRLREEAERRNQEMQRQREEAERRSQEMQRQREEAELRSREAQRLRAEAELLSRETQSRAEEAVARLEGELREARETGTQASRRLDERAAQARAQEESIRTRLEAELAETRQRERQTQEHLDALSEQLQRQEREARERLETVVREAQAREAQAREAQLREAQLREAQEGPMSPVPEGPAEAARADQESALEQRLELEAMETLLDGAARDLVGHLASIGEHAGRLLEELREEHPLNHDAREIAKSGERAARLARRLADFAARPAGERRKLEVHELLPGIGSILARLVERPVEIAIAPERASRKVAADPAGLQELAVHLAIAASEALPDEGRLIARTEDASIDEGQAARIGDGRAGEFVRLTIGAASAEGTLPPVDPATEAFFPQRGGAGETDPRLAVAYGIVKQHDGWMSMSAAAGRGLVLQVFLPAVAEQRDQKPARGGPAAGLRGNGERILIVADKPNALMAATQGLWKNGYRPMGVGSAQKALEYCARGEEAFDLVLCDIAARGKNPAVFVEELLRRRATMPVVICCGTDEDRGPWTALRERGIPFLPRPYGTPELLRQVRLALDAIPRESAATPVQARRRKSA